jgi:hypothetical protein
MLTLPDSVRRTVVNLNVIGCLHCSQLGIASCFLGLSIRCPENGWLGHYNMTLRRMFQGSRSE